MKRTLTVILAAILSFGTLAATASCGGKKKVANSATDLEIFYWEAGSGSEWLNRTIDAFVEKNPEVNVIKNFNADNSTWATELVNPDINTIDLYISSMTNFLAYTEYIEPLDDVLDYTWPGENKTLLEKNYKPMIDTQRGEDGKLYAAMWGGGICGLVYNKTIFDQKGYKIPRTTDELIELADDMVDDNLTPFIYCGNADYWMYALMPWAAQYGGIDEVYNFWSAKYVDPETGAVEQPSLKAMKGEGKREAIKTLYEILSPKGYVYSASNQVTHTDAQTLFLNGKALMMPNGSWLENEMKSTKTTTEYAFMRLPIISSLGEKLGISDRLLREVVAYVDSADYKAGKVTDGSTEYNASMVKNCSKDVIDAVAEARSINYSEAVSNRCLIPNYANAKDYAKKFIQFLNSDEALAIYTDCMHVRTLATPTVDTVDSSSWSVFTKSAEELAKDTKLVYRAKGYKLFYYSTNTEFLPYVAATYFTSNGNDWLDADGFWNKCVNYYDENWDILLQQAGLK